MTTTENEKDARAPTIYVALASTEGFGTFVVYYGYAGEDSLTVYRKAWEAIVYPEASQVWIDAAHQTLKVLSLSNARRMYRWIVRRYEQEHQITEGA
jgi:hypothetical protein